MLISNLCGLCSYINNTEYRSFAIDTIAPTGNTSHIGNTSSIDNIAKDLGPGWMGHRYCCNDDISAASYNITTYAGDIKTINAFGNSPNYSSISPNYSSISPNYSSNSLIKRANTMNCLISTGMLAVATHALYTLFKMASYKNECDKYDFADSKTLTALYSDKITMDTILKFDEKLCSTNLNYCAKIENDRFVTRRTNEMVFCIKNANRALKLNTDGSIELFNIIEPYNSIWFRNPYIKGEAPYRLIVSDIGSLRVLDSRNNIVFETINLSNPKTRYHEIA